MRKMLIISSVIEIRSAQKRNTFSFNLLINPSRSINYKITNKQYKNYIDASYLLDNLPLQVHICIEDNTNLKK